MANTLKVDLNKGEITLSLIDLLDAVFEQIDDDERWQVFETMQWYHPVYVELITTSRSIYAAKNFNPAFYKLIKDFFTLDTRYAPEGYATKTVIRQMQRIMKHILQENAELKTEFHLYSRAAFALNNWMMDQPDINNETRIKVSNKLSELQRKHNEHDNKSKYEIKREIADLIHYDEFVEHWVRTMQKLFEEEEENVKE